MKHFWVIFKLLLLIVFALRLLKSNRKTAKYEHNSEHGFFNLFQKKVFSEKLLFNCENVVPELQLKEIFRKTIRPKEDAWQKNKYLYDDFFASLSLEERLIYIATIFNKSFQKGSVFNFLWYKTEWLIAFGQTLKYLQEDEIYSHYQQVILDTTGFEIKTISAEHKESFYLDLHPDGSQEFESVKQFDQVFDPNTFFQKIISTTTQKQQNHLLGVVLP